jgi:hypothetical protein
LYTIVVPFAQRPPRPQSSPLGVPTEAPRRHLRRAHTSTVKYPSWQERIRTVRMLVASMPSLLV